MQAYVFRRLLYAVLTFFLITFVIFGAVRALPGDSVLAAFDEGGVAPSPEHIAQVRKDLGLDKPFYEQYAVWIGNVFRGDLGRSFITNREVGGLLKQALPVTLELTLLAVAIAMVISIPLGVLGGLTRGTPIDYTSRMVAVLGITIPSFVWGMVALLAGVRWFNWVPPTSYTSLIDNPRNNLGQFMLPAIILGYALAGSQTRMVRSTVLEVLRKDFVRTAYAKGLTGRVVLMRHVMRNAMIPVITLMGLQVATVLGGSIVVEQIFNLPGVGQLLLNGVAKRDYPIVQAGVLVTASAVVIVNLVVDVSYAIIDPRIRRG